MTLTSHTFLAVCTGLLLPNLIAGCSSHPKDNIARTRPVITGKPVVFKSQKPSIRRQEPSFLSYAELVQLSRDPMPSPALKDKLELFWRSPVIDNEAWFSGRRPLNRETTHLGPLLRVASWNIEKSMQVETLSPTLVSAEAYERLIDPSKAPEGSPRRETMLRQRERLADADIIFLQEMDVGVSRSNYVDAARTLARTLGMNYAFAPQALEVDPVLLGLEPSSRPLPPLQPDRYKGTFGSAILSRYPILKAEVFQLKTHVYDWYAEESKKTDLVEEGRRFGSAVVFENKITRELKVGGRCYFRVDVAVPQLPGGVLTLINNHLEIKTRPQNRQAQMDEILSYLKDVPHPVIVAGDHNTAPDDLSATSLVRLIWRQIDNPTDLLNTTATLSDLFTGTVVPLYRERGILNALKNFQNPLAPHVPLIFPNHVRGLFKSVEDFRFSDGTAFDFRGDREHSINRRKGLLANSNQKRLFGHTTTFSVQRPIGPLGRYRLDWFFVRSGRLASPRDKKGSYFFAPHFGETLAAFNDFVIPKFSDHRPIVIDLPLQEPPLPQP